MKKTILTLAVPVVLALILFTCQKQEEKKEKSKEAAAQPELAVKVSPVLEDEYRLPVISSGLIAAGTEARLSFKVGGIISSIAVEEGQSVSKGQLLATLDLTEIDAQVAQARNNLEKTKRDLERGQRLLIDSAITREQAQNLQTAHDVAAEAFRIASFNRQYSAIRATTSGKIIRKFANEGELVAPGAPVFLTNSAAQNDWVIKIGVPDVDWIRIKPGDKAVAVTDAYKGVTFDAVVSTVGEGAEPVSGLYPVEVKIKAGGRKLASGLFARVEIVPSQHERLRSVPVESIVEGNGKNAFVFAPGPDEKSVRKIPVRVAFLNDQVAVIASGLEQTDRVISAGSAFLTEASLIKIIP